MSAPQMQPGDEHLIDELLKGAEPTFWQLKDQQAERIADGIIDRLLSADVLELERRNEQLDSQCEALFIELKATADEWVAMKGQLAKQRRRGDVAWIAAGILAAMNGIWVVVGAAWVLWGRG